MPDHDIAATVECRECSCETFLHKIEQIMNMIEPMKMIKAIGPCGCRDAIDSWGQLTGNSIIDHEHIAEDGIICAFYIFKGTVEMYKEKKEGPIN